VTPLAVVVLAHADPAHLGRLVTALRDAPVVVHCDGHTPPATFAAMQASTRAADVRFAPRVHARVASWSLVLAELSGLREAVRWTNARHIAILSGSDYPLMSLPDLASELNRWSGRTWMQNEIVPHRNWDTPRQKDGGLWRFKYRYLTRADHVLFVKGIPLRWPFPREIPEDLELRAASQWKIYSREHATGLLDLVDRRPDLMRFWRHTMVPDESFAASMLASHRLFGTSALPPSRSGAWWLDWDTEDHGHPRWLSDGDFDQLKVARWATQQSPDTPAAAELGLRKLFARKFRSADSTALLDRVDAELRGA
jgi:core-2/I-Branching enzyme